MSPWQVPLDMYDASRAPGMASRCMSGRQFIPDSSRRPLCSAGSEEVREMAELHRAFFSLLHFAAANGLTGTLLRLEGRLLDSVLQELLASASAHAEAPVRRGCFQVCATPSRPF